MFYTHVDTYRFASNAQNYTGVTTPVTVSLLAANLVVSAMNHKERDLELGNLRLDPLTGLNTERHSGGEPRLHPWHRDGVGFKELDDLRVTGTEVNNIITRCSYKDSKSHHLCSVLSA